MRNRARDGTAAYPIIRPHTGSDAQALAIASALPGGWAVARWCRRRTVDLVGVVVVVGHGCAIGSSALFGTSPTPLKLRDAGVLGRVGLVCLGSVLVHRPLLPVALRHLARGSDRAPRGAERLDDAHLRRNLAGATTAAGVMFLLAAVTDVILMATASTATFLAAADWWVR